MKNPVKPLAGHMLEPVISTACSMILFHVKRLTRQNHDFLFTPFFSHVKGRVKKETGIGL